MRSFDVIDTVVYLGLAGIAIVLAAVVFLNSRRGGTVTVGRRRVRRPRLWGTALLLLGLVLLLRPVIEVAPPAWRSLVIAVTVLVATALLVLTIIAIASSRRP